MHMCCKRMPGRGGLSWHACTMTMADLGPERPGQASETREWADQGRREHEPHVVSNRRFLILLSVIAIGLAVVFFIRA